jgi:WD repeat and SOF domain-containing protein 1
VLLTLGHYRRWVSFDPVRNWPDLGPRFVKAEKAGRAAAAPTTAGLPSTTDVNRTHSTLSAAGSSLKDSIPLGDKIEDDVRDLSWATVIKRTFEAHIRGEQPNMYGEYIVWE